MNHYIDIDFNKVHCIGHGSNPYTAVPVNFVAWKTMQAGCQKCMITYAQKA